MAEQVIHSLVSQLNNRLSYSVLPITRTENEFVNQTSVSRLIAVKKNEILFLDINLQITTPAPGPFADFVEIARIENWNAIFSIYVNIPPQNGTNKILMLEISNTGSIRIYGTNGVDGVFYRSIVSVPSN